MEKSRRLALGRRGTAAFAALAALVGGGLVTSLGSGVSNASSHREAPLIAADPAVDNTDLYAFVSPERPDYVTFIANWQPFSGAQRRAELLPVRHRRRVQHQRRQRRRRQGRTPRSGGRSRTSTSAAATRSSTTTARSPRSTTRTCCSGRPTRWSRRSTASRSRPGSRDAPVAPSRVGAASMPDYAHAAPPGHRQRCPAAGRSSPARPTTRSSSTCGSSTCSTAAT